MTKIWMCLLAAFAMLACEPQPTPENPDDQNPSVENPEPEPEPEPEPVPMPEIGKEVPACSIVEFTNWQTHFESGNTIGDFSGLCFNADGTGLVGVSNYLGTLWNINFDGTRDSSTFLRTGKDMEGITYDYDNNVYYLCEEGIGWIWKAEEVDGKWTSSRLVRVDRDGDSNSGFEGITYHDGYLYIANQSPATLFIYSLEHAGVAHSYKANFITECFSDLWFDTTNNTLWAVDAWSANKEIVNFTIWGELIARFTSNVPWIEGICIDFENNKAWFACDSTGQLYSADIVRAE